MLLDGIAARISTVAQVHHRLAKLPEGLVPFGSHLHEICSGLITAFSSDQQPVHVDYRYKNCLVPTQYVQPLTLIVNELILNSLKYAHPAGVPLRLTVACHVENSVFVLTVDDDGVGLPEGFDPKKDGDLGFRAIRSLCESCMLRLMSNPRASAHRLKSRCQTPWPRTQARRPPETGRNPILAFAVDVGQRMDRLVKFLHRLAVWLFWPAAFVVIWGELTPSPPHFETYVWDKLLHFTAYFGLAGLAALSLKSRRALLFAVLALIAFGGLLEILQGLTGRDGDLWDEVANTLGAVLGAFVGLAFLRLVDRAARD